MSLTYCKCKQLARLLVLGSLPNLLHVAGPLLELHIFLFHVREGSTFCPGFWAYCNKSDRLIKKGLLWRGGGGEGEVRDKIGSCFLFCFLFVEDFSSSSACVRKMKLEMKRLYFFRQCTSWFAGIFNFTLLCTGLLSLLKAHNMLVCWVPLVCYPL